MVDSIGFWFNLFLDGSDSVLQTVLHQNFSFFGIGRELPSHFEEALRPVKINTKNHRDFLGTQLFFCTFTVLILLVIAVFVALRGKLKGDIESHGGAGVADEARQNTRLVLFNHFRFELETPVQLIVPVQLPAGISVLVCIV